MGDLKSLSPRVEVQSFWEWMKTGGVHPIAYAESIGEAVLQPAIEQLDPGLQQEVRALHRSTHLLALGPSPIDEVVHD